MTTFMKTLAASTAALALAACATNDTVLDDSQTIGVSDNDQFSTTGGDDMATLDAKFKVGCEDGDQFEARGCDDIDTDGDGYDRDIYDVEPAMATASVLELISNSGMHTRLENAIKAAELEDALMEMTDFTIFAPTDTAFANASLEGLSDDNDLEMLLKNHIVSGRYLAADVVALIPAGQYYDIPTVGGVPIQAYMAGENLRLVNGGGLLVPVLTADMIGSNGVIHVIDQVLMPDIDTPDLVSE